jgi:hypothetical protein
MEAKRRKQKQRKDKRDNNRENKRKRMSSGAMQSASESLSDITFGGDDSLHEAMATSTDAVVNEEVLTKFFRENTASIVQKIVSSEEWRECMLTQETSVRELEEENAELKSRLSVAEGAIIRCEKTIQRLEERVTDLTTRSMRDNVILKNVAESTAEQYYEIEGKIYNTLKEVLNIPDAEMMKIVVERAHRMGKPVTGKARNIVAKLNTKGKSVVMAHMKNLSRESTVRIVEQYPPEVHANRDKLWPMFVEAKEQGKKTKWNVDQLEIEGKVINPPKDGNKDINLDMTEEALKLKAHHTALTSKNNHHFQAHTVEIKSVDQVIPALKTLCADFSVAGASNMMYAYRVGSDEHSISNWEDDGEWGAGKKIMEAIRSNSSYNVLVCVTHWYGKSHLGPARFDIIKELSDSALQPG